MSVRLGTVTALSSQVKSKLAGEQEAAAEAYTQWIILVEQAEDDRIDAADDDSSREHSRWHGEDTSEASESSEPEREAVDTDPCQSGDDEIQLIWDEPSRE